MFSFLGTILVDEQMLKDMQEIVGYLCHQVSTLKGQTDVQNILLGTLITEVVEKNPELLNAIEERFLGICDLHKKMTQMGEIHQLKFDESVSRAKNSFRLMSGGGFFKN